MIRLNDEFIPPSGEASTDEIAKFAAVLREGPPAEKREALRELIARGAEKALTACLRAGDTITTRLATIGLWECWLNEKGPTARRKMQEGIDLMEAGNLEAALEVFCSLSLTNPDWAEALNKQATVLYLQGRVGDSLSLCRLVVKMKPNHFGAWNGMALCAVQMESWETALTAATEALKLQPETRANLEIAQLAQNKLGLC